MPDPPIMPSTALVMLTPSSWRDMPVLRRVGNSKDWARRSLRRACGLDPRRIFWHRAAKLVTLPSTTEAQAPHSHYRVSDPTANTLSVLNSVFGLTAFRGAQEEIVRH